MSFLRREQPIAKETLEQLYVQEKKSMQEIADELGCSVHKVQYWMDKYGLGRRGRDEATYTKRNPDGDPFDIQRLETPSQQSLFDLCVGLYIGEGTKSDQIVSLANLDPKVIQIWLRFLREICRVEEKKLFAYLNMFDDLDVENTITFWQHVTGLSRAQFFKPTVRPKRSSEYGKKSPYGTLTVGVSNKKLARKMTEWCHNVLQGNER